MTRVNGGAGRRPGRVRSIALALLGVLLGMAVAADAPAQVADSRLRPCIDALPDSHEACSGRPLDYHAPAATSLQTVSLLPAGRLGEPYKPSRILYGGTPAYQIDPRSILPAGLHVTSEGFLKGKPTKLGSNVLMLIVHDSAQPSNMVRGIYVLNVLSPRAVAPPRPQSQPSPAPPAVPAAPAESPPPAPLGQIAMWSLTPNDLKLLATPPSAAPEPPPPPPVILGPAAPPTPVGGERSPPAVDETRYAPLFVLSPDQQALLKLIVNQEYPSLALFKSAVRARLDVKGPHPVTTPDDAIDAIARQAFKPQSLLLAPRAQLKATPGCGCVAPPPPADARTTYGLFPFWRPTTGDQSIDFSLFDRIEYLGVQLKPDGAWLKPGDTKSSDEIWSKDMSAVAQTVQAHGSRLDLVLQGADWRFLPQNNPGAVDIIAMNAANNAVALMDRSRLTGLEPFLRAFLLNSLWRTRPERVFDGVTVMFQPPEGSAAAQAAFDRFYDQFVRDLVKAVGDQGRPFRVNLVTAYDAGGAGETLFRPGAFAPDKMVGYLHLQSNKQNPPLADDEVQQYSKSSKVKIKILVFIPSPTSDNKKTLRAIIDRLDNSMVAPYNIQGHARITLTDNLIPIVFVPAGTPPQANAGTTSGAPTAPFGPNDAYMANANTSVVGTPGDSDHLDVDLIYHRQNFGGAGVWSLPMTKVPPGTYVDDEFIKTFFSNRKVLGVLPICSTLLRLLWQLSVIAILIGVSVFSLVDMSAKVRRMWVAITGLAALVCAALGFVLLNLDPALNRVKIGNGPFLVTLLVLVVVGVVQYKRPKIKKP